MNEKEFREELKNLNGGYLFFGDEDYLKNSYSKEAKKAVLSGAYDDFNHIVIYGGEYTAESFVSAVSTLPFMEEKKLVELRYLDFLSLKSNELNQFFDSLSKLRDFEQTVLIVETSSDLFQSGKNNTGKKTKELFAKLTGFLKPVDFEFPGMARLRSWIGKHFSGNGITFDPSLCDYLVSVCGHDMFILSNEINKLCSYAKENNISVTDKKIIDNICCKTTEYEDFGLSNAILKGNRADVFDVLKKQEANHIEPTALIGIISRMFSEMNMIQNQYSLGLGKGQISSLLGIHEYKVGLYLSFIAKTTPKKIYRAVELCSDADISAKSNSNATSYVAVDRLVCAISLLFCR